MTRTTFSFAVLCGAGIIGTALPAAAADVRAQLTPDLIYQHCTAAGVGSEVEGTFMLPGGRVTGTILCTADDIAAANAAPPRGFRGDDDDDGGYGNDDDDNRGHYRRGDDDGGRHGDDD